MSVNEVVAVCEDSKGGKQETIPDGDQEKERGKTAPGGYQETEPEKSIPGDNADIITEYLPPIDHPYEITDGNHFDNAPESTDQNPENIPLLPRRPTKPSTTINAKDENDKEEDNDNTSQTYGKVDVEGEPEAASLIPIALSPEPGIYSGNEHPLDVAHGAQSKFSDATDSAPKDDTNKDIASATEETEYVQYLNAIGTERTKLKVELHLVVRNDLPIKLKLLCTYLTDQGTSLGSCDLVGEGNKETALCLAIVTEHNDCANVLIQRGGSELIMKPYESSSYFGATALHLAILKNNVSITEKILDRLDDQERCHLLTREASGSYFRSIYKSACQPLSLAAAIGNIQMFNIIVKHGADLWSGDTDTGNTVLHNMATIASLSPEHGTTMMFKILESSDVAEWWTKTKKRICAGDNPKELVYGSSLKAALLKAENNSGYTPLAHAACLGATKFASAILDMEGLYKFPQWNIGPTQYVLYEMNELDPAVLPNELPAPPNKDLPQTTVRASALESFAYVISDEQLDFGNITALQTAMSNKWGSYRHVFYIWMFIHLLVMISFTVCVHYRILPSMTSENKTATAALSFDEADINITHQVTDVLVDGSLSARDKAVFFLECLVLLVALFYFILEIFDCVYLYITKRYYLKGFSNYQRSMIPIYISAQFDIFRVLLFVFSISVWMVFFLRIAHSVWQDLGYALAAISGWSFMLFFTTAFQNIGIFTVMLQRMVTSELAYFSVVFITLMAGFGTGTYCLFQESLQGSPDEVATVHQTLFSHFRLLVGLEELNIADESRIPWMVKLMFIAFVLLSNILLLNMLIAAMNDTYMKLDTKKTLLWLRMRTKAVLLIERRLPRAWRSKCNLEQFGRPKQWFIGSEEVKAHHPLAGGLQHTVTV